MAGEHVDPNKPKEDCKIVIYNVPTGTKVAEIGAFLNQLSLDVNVAEISLMQPRQPKTRGSWTIQTLLAFVKLGSNEERDRVVKYFENFDALHPNEGLPFINKVAIPGRLYFNYCFKKDVMEETKRTLKTATVFPNGPSDDTELLKELSLEKVRWERERSHLVQYIEYLENAIKDLAPTEYRRIVSRKPR